MQHFSNIQLSKYWHYYLEIAISKLHIIEVDYV